ncbi:MAG: aldehyde dehydrogenase family protein [Myxococcota bacterium]
MSPYTLTIAGEAVAAESTLPVVNPATGRPFADCPDATRAQLDAAMDAARHAFGSWREDLDARRAALVRCSEALKAAAPEIGRVLTQEQGKPLGDAIGEVMGAAAWFGLTSGLPLETEILQDDERLRIELHRRPLGVVGAITPWNYPIILAVWKIAPALLAGNTLVLKPSPYTPLSSLKMGEVLRDVLPPGVFSVVAGGDELGKWITEHPAVRKISFTGSVATGKKIAEVAAPDLKRVTLELGGNDPAIVLGDVDPKAVAEKVFRAAFQNSGQVCVAVKRLYVHESIHGAVLDEVAELARSAVVGDGLEQGTQYGPVNNAPQLERVRELVDEAREAGGRIVAGGAPLDRDGYFYAPTIVADVAEGVRLVDEEQFGPALPVMPFRDVDEAIERANATHFGLGGSIWTADRERGADLARRLDCGTGWVNQHLNLVPNAPFGGAKWSGIGVENGRWGLASFTEHQVINVAKG